MLGGTKHQSCIAKLNRIYVLSPAKKKVDTYAQNTSDTPIYKSGKKVNVPNIQRWDMCCNNIQSLSWYILCSVMVTQIAASNLKL